MKEKVQKGKRKNFWPPSMMRRTGKPQRTQSLATRIFQMCIRDSAIAYYSKFYDIRHILLLGRVMSGKGGDVLLETATRVLHEEYPELTGKLEINLPDEKFRRLGQSVVAASL